MAAAVALPQLMPQAVGQGASFIYNLAPNARLAAVLRTAGPLGRALHCPQLGNGATTDRSTPTPIINPPGVTGWKKLGNVWGSTVCAIDNRSYLYCECNRGACLDAHVKPTNNPTPFVPQSICRLGLEQQFSGKRPHYTRAERMSLTLYTPALMCRVGKPPLDVRCCARLEMAIRIGRGGSMNLASPSKWGPELGKSGRLPPGTM